MASPQNDFNSPHFPPPPPHHATPPPPHVLLPPPPASPDSSGSTVLIVVVVSFGSLLLLAFLSAALFCYMKKRKSRKEKKKLAEEIAVRHMDEHKKIKEKIVQGPRGPQAVILSIENEVNVKEEILKKSEKLHEGGEIVAVATGQTSSGA